MSCQHPDPVAVAGARWCPACGAVLDTSALDQGAGWLAPEGRLRRQRVVYDWARDTFGAASMTPAQRALRLVEEVVELAQAEGLGPGLVAAVAAHVYGRPPGDPAQEAGGVGVTLLAYCESKRLSADREESRELARMLAIDPARFRERQNVKAAAGIAIPAEDPMVCTRCGLSMAEVDRAPDGYCDGPTGTHPKGIAQDSQHDFQRSI